jgi:hypothetical protein
MEKRFINIAIAREDITEIALCDASRWLKNQYLLQDNLRLR